jgi:hypothetical protein
MSRSYLDLERPGWLSRNRVAHLIMLKLLTTPSAPLRNGVFLSMAQPPLLAKEGNALILHPVRNVWDSTNEKKKMIHHAAQRPWKTTAGMLIAVMVLALDVMIGIATSRQAQNPAKSEGVPKWEAVSVKRCIDDAAGADGRGGGAPGPNASPDRYIVLCRPLLGFIQQAYITSTRGQLALRAIQVQGAPSWIESERYSITAKAESATTRQLMASVMLQQILEDRFKLKAHMETREVPGYVLTVAKGGAKLQPFQGSAFPSI